MKKIILMIFLFTLSGCEEVKLRTNLQECKNDLALQKRACEAQIADAQKKLYEYIDYQEKQIQNQSRQIETLKHGLASREEAMAHKKYCDFFGSFAIFCDKEKAEKAQALGEHTFSWLHFSILVLITLLTATLVPTIPIFAFAYYRLLKKEKGLEKIAEQLAEESENLSERESHYTDLIEKAESKVKAAESKLLELNNHILAQKRKSKELNKQLETIKKEVKAEQELKNALKNISDF